MSVKKIKQLEEQGQYKPYRFQGIEWDVRDEVRAAVKEAVSNFKERLKTEIYKFYGNISRRDALSSQYSEGLADAYETVLDLLDTTE